jgi:signal transduction histidine kinase
MDTLILFVSPWLQTDVQPLLIKELALLALVLVLAWLITYQLSRFSTSGSVLFGRSVVDGVLFPVCALALAYVAQLVFLHHQPSIHSKLPNYL